VGKAWSAGGFNGKKSDQSGGAKGQHQVSALGVAGISSQRHGTGISDNMVPFCFVFQFNSSPQTIACTNSNESGWLIADGRLFFFFFFLGLITPFSLGVGIMPYDR
jgi:hypothetical protein